ncbi:MAG: ribosome maturation factor RimP, partial [Ruthenibacterium sp.]
MAKQQAAGKATGTVQKVEALVEPILAELDLRLWDVRFEKEGPDWFLRVWIDRDTPLDIQTCEDATRAINPVLDAADPITQSYFLEVGSPGLGRRLTKDAHFTAVQGQKILAHLYRVTAA